MRKAYSDPTAHIAIRHIERKCEKMEILRGDIFYVEKSTYIGHEQGGKRPAIIVSNDTGNQFSECVEIVYLTTQKKSKLPTHVDIICQSMSVALCEQVYTVSKERLGNFIRQCTKVEMQKIDEALKISLALNKETPSKEESVTECKNKGDNDLEEIKECLLNGKPIPIDTITPNEECIRLTAERDIYKKLYEELLKKVTA
jgi:mRNA interferase MazF